MHRNGKKLSFSLTLIRGTVNILLQCAAQQMETEQENMNKAAKLITTIVTEFEAGQVFEGKVVSIKDFGAFLEFAPGKEGMVHISKIAKHRVNKVEDVLKLGDAVKAVCLGKDKMGRFSFSMRDVAE